MTDEQPQELCCEREVGLLDGPFWLSDPIGTLSIYGQVQGHPPLGGLSQCWLAQELSILYYLPAVVKLGSDGGPSSICTLAL